MGMNPIRTGFILRHLCDTSGAASSCEKAQLARVHRPATSWKQRTLSFVTCANLHSSPQLQYPLNVKCRHACCGGFGSDSGLDEPDPDSEPESESDFVSQHSQSGHAESIG